MTAREFIEVIQKHPRVLDLPMGDRYLENNQWIYLDATQVFVHDGRLHVSGGEVPFEIKTDDVLMTWQDFK